MKTVESRNNQTGITETVLTYTVEELTGRVVEMKMHMQYLQAISDTMPHIHTMERIIVLIKVNIELFERLQKCSEYSLRVVNK